MDIGRSVKVALAQRKKDAKWLAHHLGAGDDEDGNIKTGMAHYHMRTAKQTSRSIEKLAGIFELSVSEFVELGEWED